MTEGLARTPLHALHVGLGARIVPFAGYEMPVHYPTGILREHLHTRASAGLFDVSHMGQIALRPASGDVADAARALERLIPADVVGLAPGRQRYSFFTDAAGGILDDLMVANRGDHLLLVVNAARKAHDLAHLQAGLDDVSVELLDRGLIALQGPASEEALVQLTPDARGMRFMDVRALEFGGGVRAVVSRSGYTGEDGFEISLSERDTADVAQRLLDVPGVLPIGLGARDSLRLEAGLCLWGHDIDETTTPVEAALEWAIPPSRRTGGDRAGGFPGAEVILGQIASGAARRRVGLLPEGRAPMREGVELYAAGGPDTAEAEVAVGRITSGGFGPSLDAPVAMGYVPIDLAAPQTRLAGQLRGKRLPATVTRLPFVRPGYRRA